MPDKKEKRMTVDELLGPDYSAVEQSDSSAASPSPGAAVALPSSLSISEAPSPQRAVAEEQPVADHEFVAIEDDPVPGAGEPPTFPTAAVQEASRAVGEWGGDLPLQKKLLGLLAVALFGLLLFYLFASSAREAFIGEETALRAVPNVEQIYSSSSSLERNELVTVLEMVDAYAFVRTVDGRAGYVLASALNDSPVAVPFDQPFSCCRRYWNEADELPCLARGQRQLAGCTDSCSQTDDVQVCVKECESHLGDCASGCGKSVFSAELLEESETPIEQSDDGSETAEEESVDSPIMPVVDESLLDDPPVNQPKSKKRKKRKKRKRKKKR